VFESVEPFYGWLHLYSHELDERSPFYGVEHNLFEHDRKIYTFNAHPLWDEIGSESLLVKILYAHYDEGYVIIELLGEWNDLFQNDFKLLCERCLRHLADDGIDKFILICENVFHVYLEADDYYQEFASEIEDGWMCLLRARPHVLHEFVQYRIDPYFYWNAALDQLPWRKTKPWELYELVAQHYHRLLL
jgi:hypothetical protein